MKALKVVILWLFNTKIIDYESSLFSLLQLNVIIVFNTRVSFEPMTSQTSSVIRQKGESLIHTVRIRGLEMFVFQKILLALCS